MHEAYIAAFLKSKWDAVTGIGALITGGLHYGRKVGTGTIYARFVVSCQRVEHISDGVRHATYQALLEVYSHGTTIDGLKAIGSILDLETSSTSSLLATLIDAVGDAISSGAGTPGGTLLYAWRRAPGSSETLQTEDERRAGADVHVTRWACSLRVQWP